MNHIVESREFALIKSLGLNNLTNIVNGTPYGVMTSWNEYEIKTFGKMLLYNALLMCIMEPPRVIYMEDVTLPKERASMKDWELHGILDCFLDL